MSFDYSKLRGRIVEYFGTIQSFSGAMGLSSKAISDKLNGKTFFKQSEIQKAMSLLQIHREQVSDYFFNEKF